MITVFAVAYSKKSFNLSLESKSELNWDYHSIELLQMSFVWWVISNYAMEKYFPEFVIKAHKQCPSPAGIYFFKVNNGKTRTMCEIYSKLTIKTPERRHWRRSSVFIVNFEDISHLVLVLLLATLNMEFPEGKGLELVSLPCFVHDFWRKVFLLLYSINWTKILLSGSFYFVTQQASLRHLFLCLF